MDNLSAWRVVLSWDTLPIAKETVIVICRTAAEAETLARDIVDAADDGLTTESITRIECDHATY